MKIDVSIGELWDKFTILMIKKEKIKDIEKRKHVLKEIEILNEKMKLFLKLQDQVILLSCINVIKRYCKKTRKCH